MVLHTSALLHIGLGVLLSMIIGAEREFFTKSAGMRTTALVGLGSTVFTVVSREGAWIMPGMAITNADGSRVAAQIVSGIGFLGAGLIFVRRDAVRGLTTAAAMWLVASVGMAAGAGLPDVAITATVLYLAVTAGFRPLSRRMPHTQSSNNSITVTYEDGHGVLRHLMEAIGGHGVSVTDLQILSGEQSKADGTQLQTVRIDVQGNRAALAQLSGELGSVSRVHRISWVHRPTEG